jgi:hypothetical protein
MCDAIKRTGDKCGQKIKQDKYCGVHYKTYNKYTQEEIDSFEKCSGCKNYTLIENGKTCNNCKMNSGKNRKKARENVIKCAEPKCSSKVAKNGKYCGKHTANLQKEIDLEAGIRRCSSRYSCNAIMGEDTHKKCEKCRVREGVTTKSRRDLRKENNIDNDICVCLKCGSNFDMFINGNNKKSNKCKKCLEYQYNYDLNRETTREERYNGSINDIYTNAIRKAEKKEYTFDLCIENYELLIFSDCTYCGGMDDRGFNGLDRMDNNIGYLPENVTPCCMLCNYIKYTHTIDDFILYCRNIIENYPHIKKDDNVNIGNYSFDKKYGNYKSDADKRDIEFKLTESEFNNILCNECYYCANNNTNQIGIDRFDSDLCYEVINCVPCCKTCNSMKKDYDIVEFVEHCDKIVTYVDKIMEADYINQNKIIPYHILKIPNKITSKWLKNKIEEYVFSDKSCIIDNRNVYNFKHNNKYYESLIYNIHDISKFAPEIEFCESELQKEIWLYYRLKVSSFHYSKMIGKQIKMLIRDRTTKKYVGFTSISSDILACSIRDDYIGWVNKKLNNIMNITTCVGLPPFSYNYNCGKLITMLMFSREVHDYVYKVYGDKLAAITTFSLYGKSIQYDRLKQLKMIGYTSGYGSSHVPDPLLNVCKKYIKQKHANKKFKCRMHMLNFLSTELKISELVNHGNKRGIYFGYTGKNSKEFLCGNINEFVPDLLETVENIGIYWKTRWAKNRFNHLLENNKLMMEYKFNNNIIDDADYNRIKQLQYYKNKMTHLTDVQKNKILKYILDGNNINKTAKYFSNIYNFQIDSRKIKQICLL